MNVCEALLRSVSRLDKHFIKWWCNFFSQMPDISCSTLCLSLATSCLILQKGRGAECTEQKHHQDSFPLPSTRSSNYISLLHWCKWRCVIIKAKQRLFLARCATLINTTSSIQMRFYLFQSVFSSRLKAGGTADAPYYISSSSCVAFTKVIRPGWRPNTKNEATIYCSEDELMSAPKWFKLDFHYIRFISVKLFSNKVSDQIHI